MFKSCQGSKWSMGGVDFIPAKNRKTKEPFILEVNHSPGTQGISKALGKEVCEEVIEAYYDRDIWKKVPQNVAF